MLLRARAETFLQTFENCDTIILNLKYVDVTFLPCFSVSVDINQIREMLTSGRIRQELKIRANLEVLKPMCNKVT